jgi:hypothetical protein
MGVMHEDVNKDVSLVIKFMVALRLGFQLAVVQD